MPKKISHRTLESAIAILLFAGVMLAACNMPAPQSYTPVAPSPTTPVLPPEATTAAPPPTAVVTPTVPPTPQPTGTATQSPCTDSAKFVDDITVEDGTVFEPSTPFTKTWRLTNNGTCPWTTAYALVFQEGNQMGGPDTVPFTGTVAPGATVDVSVSLVSPSASGSYEGKWMLRNATGQKFGTGTGAQYPVTVEIVVQAPAEEITLGSPTWTDTFNNASNWYLLDTSATRFTVSGGDMILESFSPGTRDEWGFSTRPAISDFYLEMTARTGATCSGRDRYGFIFRAPDVDHGYVFTFTCNGSYRIYRWTGDFTSLKSWTSSSLIHAGPNQTNRLGVEAVGTTLKLYANRKLLTTITESTFSTGRFGLVVGSAETTNFKVYVEEVSYWLR
jgi:hypothetical protein